MTLNRPQSTPRLTVAGASLIPDMSGALYWPVQNTLIVADLHFEKGTSFAPRGQLLPPYDTRTTLARLAEVCARLNPHSIICLGDSFHDRGAEARMDETDAAALARLTGAHDWIWILGNHDPVPPARFTGQVVREFKRGPLTFRHEPREGPGEVAGHLHPCARVRVRGRHLRRRCFVADGNRVILPAFGAYTGGLNVLEEAYRPLFARRAFHAWMIGDAQIVPVAGRKLLPDTPRAMSA